MNMNFRLRPASLLLMAAAMAVATWLIVYGTSTRAGSNDYPLAQAPLYIGGNSPPLMMLVASRDEQLFDKAYPDYTDLDGDGVVDASYNNRFDYEGYFDPYLCYAYASDQFKATGARNSDHKCGGSKGWSGNFLNWVTMSRLDILRYVLYGGNRSVDNATETVLERAHIPNDTHAWTKIYDGADLKDYVGISAGSVMTFCNVSLNEASAPLMRVASARLPSWAETEFNQCLPKNNSDGDPDRPAANAITDFTVKVKVCDPAATDAGRERFCSRYGSSLKPTGLLQEYGETGRLRFGLVSGTYSKPRAGGVLRKNVGLFAGNGNDPAVCATGDEVKLSDGTFCNQTDDQQGIVNTLKRFKIVGWTGSGTDGAWNGSNWAADCGGWGASNRTDYGSGVLSDPGNGSYKCTPWGNPVSEMYAEALRYLAGETAGTASFLANASTDIKAGRPAWVDPYGKQSATAYGGGNSYCAACSVLVLSSGASSYDGDAIPTVSRLGDTAANATKLVGDAEQITGNNFFVGSAADPTPANLAMSHSFFCQSRAVSNLAYVRGICNEAPQREGSYLVAGLAKAAYAADLRSGNIANKPASAKVNVTTYAVALADGVPTAEIATSAGTIALTPYCQANPDEGLKRTCQLGDTAVGRQPSTGGSKHVYGRDMTSRGGSFMFSWDGSPHGESNDRDFVYMLTYCVGDACSDDTNPANNASFSGYDICWGSQSAICSTGKPVVGADEVLVRTEILGMSTGNPVRVGFNISGSTSDGLYPNVYSPKSPSGTEGKVYNLLNGATPRTDYPMDDPVNKHWERPSVVKFKAAGRASSALRPPLWYAAKYGSSGLDLNGNGKPDWDDDGDGEPDNYLLARNPAKLKAELGKLISKAAGASPVTGGGGSGARLSVGSSFSIATSFDLPQGSNDWTGTLMANDTGLDGSVGGQRWDAATVLAGQVASGSRNIRVAMAATSIGANGAKQTDAKVREFTEANLRSFDPAISVRSQLGLSAADAGWLGTVSDATLVDYLRGKNNAAPLRVRSRMLGDIVNSSLEVVAAKDDFGYGNWSAQGGAAWKAALGDSYKRYVASKRAAGVDTALVGANDGMLHAFNVADGRERFAFVPSSARERMGQLANPGYVHRYTVDGEIASADVPASASGDWRTIAVAASAAGGKSVTALNLSAPAAFNDASVLWELRGAESGNSVMSDLGYVFGRPVVVPVAGATATAPPRWVALFGNGVNSAGGAPALFVVDVNTGDVLARLKPAGSQYASRNGLFNIAAVSLYNADGIVDTVYGGDLQGNVWKFDLSAAAPASWSVDFAGSPLFVAKDDDGTAQPITGGLEVARGPGGGTVVLFGTGRYFADSDNKVPENPPVQSFYGIYDRCANAGCTQKIGDGRSGLAKRSVSEGASSFGYITRNIDQGGSGRNGWYVDLQVEGKSATGERFIGMPRLQNGNVFFTAFEPVGSDCRPGVRNWLYGLDLMTGGGAMTGVSTAPGGAPVCSVNCGGLASQATGAPVKNTNVLLPPPPGTSIVGCGADDPTCSDPNALNAALAAKQCSLVLRSEGTKPLYMPRPCGRQSWRQIR